MLRPELIHIAKMAAEISRNLRAHERLILQFISWMKFDQEKRWHNIADEYNTFLDEHLNFEANVMEVLSISLG